MALSLFDILRLFGIFFIGGPLFAEVIFYFWHRGVEHGGWLGNTIRNCHWDHHMAIYPVNNLRPKNVVYNNAGSWDPYVGATVAIILAFTGLPWKIASLLIIGTGLYTWFVEDKLHMAFHLPEHWLHKYKWFVKLEHRHDLHHFGPCNYGILFFFMDRIFGTLRDQIPGQLLSDHDGLFPGFQPR